MELKQGEKVRLYLWAAAGTEGFSAPVSKGSVSEPGWHISDSSEPNTHTQKTESEALEAVELQISELCYLHVSSERWVASDSTSSETDVVTGGAEEDKRDVLYLKLPDDSSKRRVFPALLI